MEHKIIHTENYLLIVEDFKIDVGDYYLTSDNTILLCEKILLGLIYSSGDYGRNTNGLKRITSHLPLNNFPILGGVSLLPDLSPIEDEVEKLAYLYATKSLEKDSWNGFVDGYNKAKEKYKYTEEDVIDFTMNMISQYVVGNTNIWDKDMLKETLSLKRPKMPIGFRRKEGGFVISGGLRTGDESQPPGLQTHTHYETLTMDGKVLWVGEYVY